MAVGVLFVSRRMYKSCVSLLTTIGWAVYPGDIRKPAVSERLQSVCKKLGGENGIIRRYTSSADIDSVIQVLTVFATPRLDVEKQALPEILKPKKSSYGVPGTCYTLHYTFGMCTKLI